MYDAEGCQYILDSPGEGACGAPSKRDSPYCAHHHAICYLPIGSDAERRRLRSFDLGANFGGTKGMVKPLTHAEIRKIERQLNL